TAVTFEETIVHVDGSTRTWLTTKVPLWDVDDPGDRRTTGVVSVSVDVSEQVRTERSLRESEERFRLLAFNSTDIIARSAPTGEVLFISPACTRLLGWRPDELLGRTRAGLIHPDDRAATDECMRELMASTTTDSAMISFRHAAKDGRWVWLESSLRAIRHPRTNALVEVQCSSRDVTERRAVEEALRERESQLRRITDALPGIVFQFAIDAAHRFKFQFVSRKSQEIWGVSAEEAVANPEAALSRLPPEDRLRLREAAVKSSKELSRIEIELRLVDPDGSVRWMVIAAEPARTADGASWTGLVLDVTERKSMEEALQRSKDAAEAASRAKSEFLANVSHELRTPLNGILGLARLALDDEGQLFQRERLQLVLDSGETLLSLVNDLLDLAKIEAGKIDLSAVPFDVCGEIGQLLRSTTGRAHAKGLDVALLVAPDVPATLVGDPHRLRQVVLNLVGNAVKFTEHGGVAVSIHLRRRVGATVELMFSVRDTGIGIPPEKVERIFRPFEQADSSTTRRYGGTGLGLTIVARLVDRMGGAVAVSSAPGMGSDFQFTALFDLPTSPGGPVASSTSGPATLARSSTAVPALSAAALVAPPPGLRVLVADSVAFRRSTLSEAFRLMGSAPTQAAVVAEVEAALRDASAGAPQLLVVDELAFGEATIALLERWRGGLYAGPLLVVVRPES
ncbi:MAG: PAS domain S-box protein, partial [Planctomycetia bacterium]